MKQCYQLLIGILLVTSCTSNKKFMKEIQVTHDAKNHDLDNNDNFSADGKWLVYDTRTEAGGIGGNASIESVNIETDEIKPVFNIPGNHSYGPGVGAASFHPLENKVIFIHGPANCTEQNPYQQWHRTGVIVDVSQPNLPIYMDSRDVTFPFTPGALRGGTHRHEWRRGGKWIGFTYNDAIMKKLEDSTGIKWNMRTIGVANQQRQVAVDKDEAGENVNGTWYSVLVVRVTPNPKPGSDEINNAASDSWVGTSGYKRQDRTMQNARAFIGSVRDKDGKTIDELFIVDIPDSLNIPGEYGPIEGTRTSFPMPPKGTIQRRLTHTANSKYSGCKGVVRSSPDGTQIAYIARDKNGVQQIFTMSPLGGEPVQITSHNSDVQSAVRWSPDNKSIIYLWDNSIVMCEVSGRPFEERFKRLTAKTTEAPSNLVWSDDGKTIAFNRSVIEKGESDPKKQIFIIRLDAKE